MLRKIFIQYFIASTLASIAWAGDMGPVVTEQPAFNGYYVGGALGPSYARAQESVNAIVNTQIGTELVGTVNLITPLNLNIGASTTALLGSLFIGYGHTWEDQFYLGGELAVTESNYKMTNSLNTALNVNVGDLPVNIANATLTTQANISPTQFTAVFRPGYLLTADSLLFARLGVAVARTSFKTVTNGSFFALSSTLNPSTSKLSAYFQTGGGLEQRFNQHWTARIDYIYTNYGHLRSNVTTTSATSFDILGNTSPVFITLSGNNRVTISDQSVLFGLTYQF